MLADQRRLISPGEAVDDAGGFRPPRQQRPGHRVSLHIDHDDVLAVGDCREREADAGFWIAGRLDHHLDVRKGDQRISIGGDVGASGLARIAERACGKSQRVPARRGELRAGTRHVEIGDPDEMQAAHSARLSEKHGAELAGPDQPDGDGPAGSLPLEQLGMEVHDILTGTRRG
jgi:hypothetical protein